LSSKPAQANSVAVPLYTHCSILAKYLAGHPTKHTISSNPEEAGELLSSSELEARRPDGFKFIIAPVLRGEGNWPTISLYGTMEQRIHFTVDALLARIPFWFKVCLSYVFFWFATGHACLYVCLQVEMQPGASIPLLACTACYWD